MLKNVFEHCSNICRKSKQTYLGSFDFLSEKFVGPRSTLLEEAANGFVQQFSENFLLLYCDKDQKAQAARKSKKVGMSSFAQEKQKKELQLLKEYEKFLSSVFSNISSEITTIVSTVGDQIQNVVTSKPKEFFIKKEDGDDKKDKEPDVDHIKPGCNGHFIQGTSTSLMTFNAGITVHKSGKVEGAGSDQYGSFKFEI